MNKLRTDRKLLGISQSRLARVSGVSRFKICTFELGGGSLTELEVSQISQALEAEATRLLRVAVRVELNRNEGEGL